MIVGSYAILGSASFLGGTTRMTVSMCVMLLELTNNLQLLPPMMLVLLIAKFVGDLTGVGPLYDLQAELKGIPLLPNSLPENISRENVRAKDVVFSHPITFNAIESVRTIIETLRATTHNAFPVMGHINVQDPQVAHLHGTEMTQKRMLGTITRQQLMVVLSKKDILFSGNSALSDQSKE